MVWRLCEEMDKRGVVIVLMSKKIAVLVLAGMCALTACKTGKSKPGNANLVEAPRTIEIVEPEGVNLSDVIAFHGIDEFKNYYYYSSDTPPEKMSLYRHQFVELDGEAPAEVILTMARKMDMDMLDEMGELPIYTSVIHHVYTFKNDNNGEYLGSFATDLMNPFSLTSLKITPLELDDDARQELLLTDDTSYYISVQLFELQKDGDRIQDVIWGQPEARSYIPFDHDNDGTLDLMAIPSAEVVSGLSSWYRDEIPREPFILERDDQGFWHEQPTRRPFETWATAMLLDYLKASEQVSYAALDGLKEYGKTIDFTYPPEVYDALMSVYEGIEDPFERAEMLMSMPMASPDAVNQLCEPLLSSGDSLEMSAACFAALADMPDQANRDLILEYIADFQRKMSEYPQLHQRYYQNQKLSSLAMWLSRAFESEKDDRLLTLALTVATEDVNDQNFYIRTGALYPLMQWKYDDKLADHRFILDVFFNRLREAIKNNQGYAARVIMEPLFSTALGSTHWYVKSLEKDDENIDKETIARGKEAKEMLDKELPASLFEPLIVSSDPQLRILAIHYFANADIKRFAELFRTRVDVEKDEMVRQELFNRLYVLTDDKTLSKAFWRAQIIEAVRSPDQNRFYHAYGMLPYYVAKATPAEIAELWDEVNNTDLQIQFIWYLPQDGQGQDLSSEAWAPMRERVLDFFKQSTNSHHRSSMMYLLPRMKSPEVIKLLRDIANKEQELYVLQGALQALITMKDEEALALLKLREDELREQPYMYSSMLYAVSEHMPEEGAGLMLKELQKQDPTQPIDNQLLWMVARAMYHEDAKVPRDIVDWFRKDVEAGLGVEGTSCIRLGQQVMTLFLAGEQEWERKLEQVEAHPNCKSASTPYVARKFAVDAAISMSYQPQYQHSKLFSFIRQHHDFPYRPIRMSVAQFELRLKEMAEEKKKKEQQKLQQNQPPSP